MAQLLRDGWLSRSGMKGQVIIQNLYEIKKCFTNTTFQTVSRQSCALFYRKLWIYGLIMNIWGFSICGLAHLRKLRIFDGGMSPKICGFASLGHLKKVCLPTSGINTYHKSVL
jgi:hypothetical protein